MGASGKWCIAIARLACGLVYLPTLAWAAPPDKQACVSAYERAQLDMRRAKLTSAHEALVVCLDEGCPATLRQDCAPWLREVEARQPAVVFSYIDARGESLESVRVLANDQELVRLLDGRAMPVDPGETRFVFIPPDGRPRELRIVVREGEKSQSVAWREPLVTAAPASTGARLDAQVKSEPVRWPAYVGIGATGAGVLGFATFGLLGLGGKSDLDGCRPRCGESDVSVVRTHFILADVSLVVAALGMVTTAISLATGAFSSAPTPKERIAR